MASKKSKKKGKGTPTALIPINRRAAGIDIGSRFHVVAVPSDMDADDEPVRSFQSFTGDLNRLADWLAEGLGIIRDGRDGVDKRLLDPRLRDPRNARFRGCARKRA